MFHSAALKLTVWYLAIIMAISIVFSVSLYHVSAADLGRNAQRQIGYYNNFLPPGDISNYSTLRRHQLAEDYDHLKTNLVLFNVMVLVLGGAASYLLARRTLWPIENALASQSRFASDASHELRTPLAAMQAENEVALRNPALSKKQAVDLLKSNLEEVAKLKVLSEGLLKLAKGNGHLEEPQAVSLKHVADLAVSRLAKVAAANKIIIVNRVKPLKVLGDQDSLVELASIFLDNAIKYSRPGGQVKLASGRRDKEVWLSVTDSGSGIAAADLPHIFERFYRTDSSRTKQSAGGYGLGLAIAKQIADVHSGHIEVKSSAEHGSTFTVYLPVA